MLHVSLLTDRPLGEHICFALQLSVFRQDFQGGKQIVRGIVSECLRIGSAVNQSKSGRKAVIQRIQLCLKLMDREIIRFLKLRVHQTVHAVPKGNHALDARFCCSVQIRVYHSGVFPVIHLVINNGIGIVPYIGISGNAVPDGFTLRQFGCFLCPIGTGDLRDRFSQLLGKVCTFQRLTGSLLVGSIHGIVPDHLAENHIGMIRKVAVDRHAVFRLAKMYPVRLNVDGPVALLQEDDV